MPLAPFILADKGVHPVVDFDALESYYPDIKPDVFNIGSASDLISWEQLRHWHGIEDPKAVSCDVFVWGKGKPPNLRMTRVGGTPFLPKRIPWPTVNDTVTQFLCQFDFRDSRNLTGQTVSRELPGDLLLVFVADQEAILTADMEKLRFIWVSADELDEDIMTASDLPEPTHAFEFTTAWGVRFRTVDVPSKWDAAYDSYDEAGDVDTWRLPVYWATKIGGVPYHSQEIQRSTPPDYLCQLTSIQVSDETKWPWVNEEQPMHLRPRGDGIHDKKNCLMIGDMGELTLYLSKNGEISVDGACG